MARWVKRFRGAMWAVVSDLNFEGFNSEIYTRITCAEIWAIVWECACSCTKRKENLLWSRSAARNQRLHSHWNATSLPRIRHETITAICIRYIITLHTSHHLSHVTYSHQCSGNGCKERHMVREYVWTIGTDSHWKTWISSSLFSGNRWVLIMLLLLSVDDVMGVDNVTLFQMYFNYEEYFCWKSFMNWAKSCTPSKGMAL